MQLQYEEFQGYEGPSNALPQYSMATESNQNMNTKSKGEIKVERIVFNTHQENTFFYTTYPAQLKLKEYVKPKEAVQFQIIEDLTQEEEKSKNNKNNIMEKEKQEEMQNKENDLLNNEIQKLDSIEEKKIESKGELTTEKSKNSDKDLFTI